MAKSKSRSGAAPGAPKPKVEPRKQPLAQQRGFRWAALVAGGLVLLWILTAILGGIHRTSVLKGYDRDLAEAQQPFTKYKEPANEFAFTELPTQFLAGQASVKKLKDASLAWQRDFAQAANNVRALTPPEQLVEAQEEIASAFDVYGAAAKQYGTLADLRAAIEKARPGRAKDAIVTAFNTALAGVGDVRTQADALYGHATASITDLEQRWGIKKAPVTSDLTSLPPGFPIPDQGSPG
jgi:hypothetical protein